MTDISEDGSGPPYAYIKFVKHPASSDSSLPIQTQIAIGRNPFIIGRNPTSGFVLNNPCVSGVHLTLTKQLLYSVNSECRTSKDEKMPFCVVLADMSRNGCYVNGIRIGKGNTTILQSDDVVDLVVSTQAENNKYNLRFRFFKCQTPNQLPPQLENDSSRSQMTLSPEIQPCGEVENIAHEDRLHTGHIDAFYTVHYDRCLGRGTFAAVFEATSKVDGTTVAIKEIFKRRLLGLQPSSPNDQPASGGGVNAEEQEAKQKREVERQKREAEVLLAARHPHVIQCLHVVQNDEKLWFAMPLAKGGELFSLVRNCGPLPEVVVRQIALQTASALSYLHSLGIAHRDIKLENLLLFEPIHRSEETQDYPSISRRNSDPGRLLVANWGEKLNVLVSDFGLSRILRHDTSLLTTMCGTPIYVAPEVTDTRFRSDSHGYTPAVDCFSLGVVLFALLMGKPPFPYARDGYGRTMKNRVQYSRKIDWTTGGKSTRMISEDAKHFVELLLKLNPDERPTAAECITHRWLKNPNPAQCEFPPAKKGKRET